VPIVALVALICMGTTSLQVTPQVIAQRVASSHEYIPGVYDCDNFSTDLVLQLRKAGYNANKCYGYCEGNWHYWVEVNLDGGPIYIEATQGRIIPPQEYGQLYHFVCYDTGGLT